MKRLNLGIGWLLFGTATAGFASGPLDQWQLRNPPPTAADLETITYANGLFVAGGANGLIASSADGTNWTSRNIGPLYGPGTNYNFEGVAWGSGLWVVVGYGNYPEGGDFPVILTSPDLRNWTIQTGPPSVTTLNGVVYGQGIFVAYGLAGWIITSPDGVHWTEQDSGTTKKFMTAIYGNGLFVVGGNALVSSPDGIHWSTNSIYPYWGPIDIGYDLDTALYQNGLYLAGGGLGIVTSSDGINWTNWVETTMAAVGLAYGNGLFLALGPGGQILTSSDGSTWQEQAFSLGRPISGLTAGDQAFVAFGQGRLLVSNDGVQWSNEVAGAIISDIDGVAYGQGTFVAVGDKGVISYSPDGARWANANVPASDTNMLESVAYGAGSFVAVGQNALLLSTDGMNWTDLGSTNAIDFSQVIYAHGQFMAVGNQNYSGMILTSTNGSTWTAQDVGQGQLWGLTYGNGLYVTTTGASVVTSPDGISWSAQNVNGVLDNVLQITYGNGVFVAVGDGGLILSSKDCLNWSTDVSGTSDNLFSVAYANGTFLATGWGGTILTSTDGTNWVSRNSGTLDLLTGAAYGQETFVVVGGSGTILQSGIMPGPSAQLSVSPGWTNGLFGLSLAAPLGGQWQIQASTDLHTWTPLGTATITNNTTSFFDVSATNFQQRFYRAVILAPEG